MGIPLEISIGRLTGYPHHCQTNKPLYRETPPETFLVCLHCRVETVPHRFYTGEFLNESHHCATHGPVTAIRSAVRNLERPSSPKSASCSYCGHPADRHFVGCSRPRRAEQETDWSAA